MKIDSLKLFALWHSKRKTYQIAEELGVTRGRLFVLARRMGLPRRDRSLHSPTRPTEDPDEDTIAERAAAIRATWSQEEHDRRLVGMPRGRLEIANYVYGPSGFQHSP